MKTAILTRAAAGFAVVTTEYVIIGILPRLAEAFGVSIATADLQTTIFAFTVALAAPVLTSLVAGIERRCVFTVPLAAIAMSNPAFALVSTFEALAAARILGALALPVFLAVGKAAATLLGGRDGAGRSVGILRLRSADAPAARRIAGI